MKQNKIIKLSLSVILLLQVNILAESIDSKTSSLGTLDVISSNENDNSYTVGSMNTSTKLNLSIRDTPQSVSVITSQQIEDRGIVSYENMLNNITGVTLNRWDERLNSSARGFVIDYYKIDGMPTYTEYNDRDIDLSLYDRVEVVRGANGLTTGTGNPGMSINLVRKRADSKKLEGSFKGEIGSWNSYSATADVSSGLNENGSVRGRVVLKHENKESFMDKYKKENTLFYGVVDIDINDDTSLSTGISYQNSNKEGIRWGGLPAFYSDGSQTNFDRSLTVSEDWTYWNNQTNSIFTDLKHTFSNDITLNANYSYSEIETNTALLYFNGSVNKINGTGISSMDFQATEKNKEHNLDVNVNIPFILGSLEQEIIVGATYNSSKKTKYDARYPVSYYDSVPNFFNYNLALPSSSIADIPYIEKPEKVEQKALYIAGKFQMTDDFKVIAGSRLSTYKYTSTDDLIDTRKFDNELTPYLGFVYDLNTQHSIYASYTSIFKTQNNKDKNGDYLDPIEGNSYETGIKGEYFDKTLNASLSFFRTEQDNVGEEIDGVFVGGVQAYKAAEGVTSKGIEFEIAGELTDNLSLDFGIANFHAKEKDNTKFNTKASRTTANIFATYKFKDFTIGGGINYKSKYYVESATQDTITQDAFYLVNAMASYKINKALKFQINIQNLMDEKYYEGIGANSMVYGSPVNYSASLKYTF